MKRLSSLVIDLHHIRALYGNIEVRADLGSETVQRAYGLGCAMCATFPHQQNESAVVLFLQKVTDTKGNLQTAYTCDSLIHDLLHWCSLMGDVVVRLDLGFIATGQCHDIDNVILAEFPNEQKSCVVLYPSSTRIKINHNSSRGISAN